MTILPLIERELRARARQRAVYWTRFAVALVGILLCVPTLASLAWLPGTSQNAAVHGAFQNLVMAAFLMSCCAGFLTVDGICRQRREGTLGLLCLTRVKTLDVLLGSFGAAGITCFCGLLAFVPVIMLPVLAGGVTGGEAFRAMLVLFDTLLLSLATGLWASSGAWGLFRSAWSAALVLLPLIGVPVWPGAALGIIALISPLVTLANAWDVTYRLSAGTFWVSLGAVHLISWLFLMAAGFRLRRTMREGDGMIEAATEVGGEVVGERKPLGGGDDPIRWLVRRQRGIKTAIWAGTLIGLIGQSEYLIIVIAQSAGWPSLSWLRSSSLSFLNWPMSLTLSVLEGGLFGWAASRFLMEGRRNGELELLLTTPVGARSMVSSQWRELKKLFVLPVIVLLLPLLISILVLLGQDGSHNAFPTGKRSILFSVAIPTVFQCADRIVMIGALIWTSLWFGLKARSQAVAILRIILFCKGAPYVFSFGNYLLFNRLLNGSSGFGGLMRNRYMLVVYLNLGPTLVIFLYNLWLMRWARRRLATELRNEAGERFSLPRQIYKENED